MLKVMLWGNFKILFLTDNKKLKRCHNIFMNQRNFIAYIWNNLHPVTHFWIIISSIGFMCLCALFNVG